MQDKPTRSSAMRLRSLHRYTEQNPALEALDQKVNLLPSNLAVWLMTPYDLPKTRRDNLAKLSKNMQKLKQLPVLPNNLAAILRHQRHQNQCHPAMQDKPTRSSAMRLRSLHRYTEQNPALEALDQKVNLLPSNLAVWLMTPYDLPKTRRDNLAKLSKNMQKLKQLPVLPNNLAAILRHQRHQNQCHPAMQDKPTRSSAMRLRSLHSYTEQNPALEALGHLAVWLMTPYYGIPGIAKTHRENLAKLSTNMQKQKQVPVFAKKLSSLSSSQTSILSSAGMAEASINSVLKVLDGAPLQAARMNQYEANVQDLESTEQARQFLIIFAATWLESSS